jgi:predicted metalloprotease with PDZ domain
LQTKAAGAAPAIAQDLVDGKPITLPELKLIWQKVAYSSKVEVAGKPVVGAPKVNHAAFVLVYETTGKPPADYDQTPDRTLKDDSEKRPKWRIGARYGLGPTGCRVTFLKPSGSAEKAGLKIDDVMIKADGKSLGVTDNTTDLVLQAIKDTPDQDIELEVLSNGVTSTTTLKLEPIIE